MADDEVVVVEDELLMRLEAACDEIDELLPASVLAITAFEKFERLPIPSIARTV